MKDAHSSFDFGHQKNIVDLVTGASYSWITLKKKHFISAPFWILV